MRRASETPKIGIFQERFGIGQLESVSYGVVHGMSYCVDNEKVVTNGDDRQERELRVELCRLIVKTYTSWMIFWDVFSP